MDHYIDRNNFRKVILNYYYSYLHKPKKRESGSESKRTFQYFLRSLSILAICFFKFSHCSELSEIPFLLGICFPFASQYTRIFTYAFPLNSLTLTKRFLASISMPLSASFSFSSSDSSLAEAVFCFLDAGFVSLFVFLVGF